MIVRDRCQEQYQNGRGTVVMQGITEAAGLGVDKLKNQFESEILGGIPEECQAPQTRAAVSCHNIAAVWVAFFSRRQRYCR